ncbi:hypothetical protein D3C76_455000 [compost metagenome]
MTKQVRDLSLEEIKSYDDSYWLHYLKENTIFDTENIRTHKEWLINQVEAEKERGDSLLAMLERVKSDIDEFRVLTGTEEAGTVEEQAEAFNRVLKAEKEQTELWREHVRKSNIELEAAEAREKKLREAIERYISEDMYRDDAEPFFEEVLASLYPKEEEAK